MIIEITDDKITSYLKEIIFDSLPDGMIFRATQNKCLAKEFQTQKEADECVEYLKEELASFYTIKIVE